MPDDTPGSEGEGMKLSGSIELRNVPFFQPEERSMKVSVFLYRLFNRQAVHNINLDIKVGERVAIIVEDDNERQRFLDILRGISLPSQGQVI